MGQTRYPQFQFRLVTSYLALAIMKFLFVVGALTVSFWRIRARVSQGELLDIDQMANIVMGHLAIAFLCGMAVTIAGAFYVSGRITESMGRIRAALKKKLRGEARDIECSLSENDYFSDLVPLLKCLSDEQKQPQSSSASAAPDPVMASDKNKAA